jgi:type IV pilus assembly protein PilV
MLKRPLVRSFSRRRGQRGFTLLESLIAVSIFTIGTLAMVGLHARAARLSTDAQQRAEAAFLANQLLARMMVADPATAASFAHHPDGTTNCAPTGAASTNTIVTEWLAEVTAIFPRASSTEQQIKVTGTPPNEVTVKLCWKNAATDTPHVLEVSNRVQWP